MLSAAVSRAVGIVAELGVADLVDVGKAKTAAELAAATGSHARSLYRLMRFLASHGVFRETAAGGEFEHTALSAVLREDAPGSYRAGARMFHHLFAAWHGMDHSVKTGEPGFNQSYGMPVFEYVAKHPHLGPIVDGAMSSFHGSIETNAMLEAYDFSGIAVLADIGGGNGELISGVLRRYPALRGMLFDLGHVMERAKARLAAEGLAGRCEVIEGSFWDTVPAGADAYLMRHIIHDWNDEQCIGILGRVKKVLPKDGRVLVVEGVIPPGNDPSLVKNYDMTMMTFPGGLERTEAEYRELFRASGLVVTSVTPTTSMVSVVEGRHAS